MLGEHEACGRRKLLVGQIEAYLFDKGHRQIDIPGMERFPRNLIIGVRSAWAAEARRALVANILRTEKFGIDQLVEEAGRRGFRRTG
jgi:hypothetical protein